MKTVTASDLKNKTGATIDAAQKGPVSIEKHGRPIAVIIPQEEYDRLIKIENDYWLSRAAKAEKSSYIGTKATAKVLKEKLSETHADS